MKKQPKKRGQNLWDTDLPVVALAHRLPGDPGCAVSAGSNAVQDNLFA